MDSPFISDRVIIYMNIYIIWYIIYMNIIYMNTYEICFTRYISGTNLQILLFTPIMRYKSGFATGLPRVSPFIRTNLCRCVCVCVHAWQGHHPYRPLLNIHSSSLNKQINQRYRCNAFLFLALCSVLPLPTSWPGLWVAQGQEAGEMLCSQPVPCTSRVGPLPWGTRIRTEWGWRRTTHHPLPLHTSTLLRLLLQQLATGHPWVVVPCSASQGVPHSFLRHRELPVWQQCPCHAGMTNHLGTCAFLGVPCVTYGAHLCAGAREKQQPRRAAGQHIFVLLSACSESLWQPCPNNPVGQKCKQLHAQEVSLKMPFISRRGKIWDPGCGELTHWPFILRGHRCLKTAQLLNEITLGGPGLLRKEIFLLCWK